MHEERQRYRSFVMDSARWDGFEFRPDDIVISTPAKCGTTWMQMITALLVFQTTTFHRPLAEISLWLDMQTAPVADVVAQLDAQVHRRFIKSHTPLDGLPWDDRVTYVSVGRDPRDVALSWDNHMSNMSLERLVALRAAAVGLEDLPELGDITPPAEDLRGRFRQWVDAGREASDVAVVASLSSMVHHVRTFWAARDRPNVVLFHYSELMGDLEGGMRHLAGRLGIEVPEERWPQLVDAARFERMKARADELAPNTDVALWNDNARFFHSARSGGWRELLDDEELRRYEARLEELDVPPDLRAWLHQEPAVAPVV